MTTSFANLLVAGPNRISPGMIRPCFLVIDNQYPGSISTRKLVIETALLNVLTAYSAEEAIALLKRFPAVDGIVLDTEVKGMACEELIPRLRAVRSDLPIVTVSPSGYDRCGAEDFHVSSYGPQDLLEQLNHICPKETREAAEESDSPQ
jgi:CheY-like chemotaxis protein